MTDLHSEKAAGAAAPNPQPGPQTPPKPAAKRPSKQEQEKPVRRVGSVTLGLCLMAVGVCFLCYYFVPGFDWLLVVKVGAPLALVALGVETLWCAARPGRWKYDFLAVFGCLVLMGGAFCLTLVPLFWEQVSPERRTTGCGCKGLMFTPTRTSARKNPERLTILAGGAFASKLWQTPMVPTMKALTEMKMSCSLPPTAIL